MINPAGLLDHARRLAGSGPGRPADADLRRGVSAAYYAVFHDLTDRAARHLIGSSSEADRNGIRRSWSHGEVASLATLIVERANMLNMNPAAPQNKELSASGPLADIAARDGDLVGALHLFGQLQDQRHLADYDHEARFEKLSLLRACADADEARDLLAGASAASRSMTGRKRSLKSGASSRRVVCPRTPRR